MDWLKDVYNKFGNLEELKSLKDGHFTGSVKFNFCNGSVNTCEKFAKQVITVTVSPSNQQFGSVVLFTENLYI